MNIFTITTALPNNQSSTFLILYLIIGKYRPNNSWNDRKFRVKFALRSLLFPIATFKYFNQLLKLPNFRQILSIHGLLLIKPHRPYLCAGFNVSQRAQVIIDHYYLINQLDNVNLRQILQSPNDYLLASFKGKNNERFLLYCCPSRFDREGEITLELHYQSLLITSLSFSIFHEKQLKTLLIGGLQGAHKHISNRAIYSATKAVYGLFPKRLLVETVFILANLCNVQKIIAVSDVTHVFRSIRYRNSKSSQFFSSYSEFWLSLGGKVREDNLFILPLFIARKNLKEIVSKKRATYRRRYELLDNLIEQLYKVVGIKYDKLITL